MARAKVLKKYLITYHSPASAIKKMQTATKEEMEAGMAEWMNWANKCGNQLLDMGSPLTGGLTLKGEEFKASTRKVTGYSIIQAPTIAGAKKLIKGHPHLSWARGCEIELHEMINMGG